MQKGGDIPHLELPAAALPRHPADLDGISAGDDRRGPLSSVNSCKNLGQEQVSKKP